MGCSLLWLCKVFLYRVHTKCKDVRECLKHSGVFKLFEKHHLHNKQRAVYKLPVYVYYSLLLLQEKALFPIRPKNGCSSLISRTLFTCTSCSQLPASTCRTPSIYTEIGSCFKNKQESDLGLRQKRQESCVSLVSCLLFLLWNSWFLTPGVVSDHS